MYKDSLFSTSSPAFLVSLTSLTFFITAIITGVKWYLIAVLICSFDDYWCPGTFSMSLLAICLPSLEKKCLIRPFALFKNQIVCLFCYWNVWVSYILWYPLSYTWLATNFFLYVGYLPFLLIISFVIAPLTNFCFCCMCLWCYRKINVSNNNFPKVFSNKFYGFRFKAFNPFCINFCEWYMGPTLFSCM